MKAVVDRLSVGLTDRYALYIESFAVKLWSEAGFIEFRCAFNLFSDQALRSFTLKVPAVIGETDSERELLIIVVFEQIEQLIDKAIAENRAEVN
ncbi:MAG TPA: hypothetical protein VIL30_06805 [Ramlibacter sp.]|jgi:hypothetical protein